MHTREWATRVVHESSSWKYSAFVTLTYDNEHLPQDGGLCKRDLTLFIKRLRKALDNEQRRIRYYAAGEYGEENGRPHYHAILFGVGPKDKAVVKSAWRLGFVHQGTVTFDSAAYVASYVFKKYNGELKKEVYGDKEAPFQTTSQGIGLSWARENISLLKGDKAITVKGVPVSTPRYYKKKLELEKSIEELNMLAVEAANASEELMIKRGVSELNVVEYKKAQRKQKHETQVAKLQLKGKKL